MNVAIKNPANDPGLPKNKPRDMLKIKVKTSPNTSSNRLNLNLIQHPDFVDFYNDG